MPKCFVVMPITTPPRLLEQYGGDQDHFGHVLEHLFRPAIEACEFEMIDPRAQGSEVIHANIIQNIENAEMVLCDMSSLNPNVFFELGVRTALNKPICLVKDDLTQSVPFDLGVINHHTYSSELNVWDLQTQIAALSNHLRSAAVTNPNQNALWKYFSISATASSVGTVASPSDKTNYIIQQLETMREEMAMLRRMQRSFAGDDPRATLMSPRRRFGEVARQARLLKGLSREELGQMTGLSPEIVLRLERGSGGRRKSALRLCDLLGLDPLLVTWRDSPSAIPVPETLLPTDNDAETSTN
jgi:hypothetical protein